MHKNLVSLNRLKMSLLFSTVTQIIGIIVFFSLGVSLSWAYTEWDNVITNENLDSSSTSSLIAATNIIKDLVSYDKNDTTLLQILYEAKVAMGVYWVIFALSLVAAISSYSSYKNIKTNKTKNVNFKPLVLVAGVLSLIPFLIGGVLILLNLFSYTNFLSQIQSNSTKTTIKKESRRKEYKRKTKRINS